MTERTVRIVPIGAAWYEVVVDEPDLRVMVRLSLAPTGRLAVVELVIGRWPGVTADGLRAIPIGKVESWANGAARDELLADLDKRQGLSEADRDEADRLARMRPSFGEPPPGAVAATEEFIERISAKPVRSRMRKKTLEVPEGQPKPDRFYRDLARLYEDLALDTPRPAAVIAEANGVPVRRVHGWVKEARRRGLLAPGERQARRPR